MGVNAKGIYLMSRGLLQHLAEPGGTILNIISNASHIPMTASAAYNASKGAAHILTQQLARELTKMHDVTVFGISPAKLRGTKMSQVIESEVCRVRGWTPEQAAEYQKGSLLTGEIDPATLAEFIEWLLIDKEHHRHFSGCVIPYGA
jgi:3-oxoacyl-[acyl-carrier protein] reductase